MVTHNPQQIIEQLQVVLSNPSKKIGFLFGAGISTVDKRGKNLISSNKEMLLTVIEDAEGKNKVAIENIKVEIGDENFNVETLLSKISEKEKAAGSEKLCGLTKDELVTLRENIENKIRDIVSVHKKSSFKDKEIYHHDFAKWIKNADRKFPVEIFTTNYDYLLETGLESQKIPYFDGFIGSYKAFFCPEWIENDRPIKEWTKLWKLHGSLGWSLDDNEIIRLSGSDSSAMIYPSYLKYDRSRKQPYLSYMDRLSYFIKQEDAVLFVCGYSFGDDHINELILTALSNSRSSHVFVLKRSNLDETSSLAEYAKNNSRISVYAKRTAIIGCKYGEWKLEKVPSKNESYNIVDHGFDEDGVTEDEAWSGSGDFRLGSFDKLSKFLSLFYTNSKYILSK